MIEQKIHLVKVSDLLHIVYTGGAQHFPTEDDREHNSPLDGDGLRLTVGPIRLE